MFKDIYIHVIYNIFFVPHIYIYIFAFIFRLFTNYRYIVIYQSHDFYIYIPDPSHRDPPTNPRHCARARLEVFRIKAATWILLNKP